MIKTSIKFAALAAALLSAQVCAAEAILDEKPVPMPQLIKRQGLTCSLASPGSWSREPAPAFKCHGMEGPPVTVEQLYSYGWRVIPIVVPGWAGGNSELVLFLEGVARPR